MTIELGILLSVIGCFVGLMGYLAGRDKKLSADSEWKGTVNAKLDLLLEAQREHDAIRSIVSKHAKDIVALQHDLDNIKSHLQIP